MAYNRESNFIVNENQIASFLSDALKNVEESTESEIQILNQIKKLFKKNVGFSRRNYVAALLVKQALSNSRSRFGRNDGKNPRGEDRFGRDSRFKNDRAERNSRPSRNDRDSRKNEGFDEAAPEREKAPRVQIDPALAGTWPQPPRIPPRPGWPFNQRSRFGKGKNRRHPRTCKLFIHSALQGRLRKGN